MRLGSYDRFTVTQGSHKTAINWRSWLCFLGDSENLATPVRWFKKFAWCDGKIRSHRAGDYFLLFSQTFSVFAERSLEVLEMFKIPANIRTTWQLTRNIGQLIWELFCLRQIGDYLGNVWWLFRWMFAEYSRIIITTCSICSPNSFKQSTICRLIATFANQSTNVCQTI